MAIPTVRDWSATETITETKLDEISTALNYLLAPPRCYAHKVGDGIIASSTWEGINFGGEQYDSHGAHDNVTNNSRLTAPEPGLYGIVGHTTFAANATGIRIVQVRKNAGGVQANGTELVTVTIPSGSASITCRVPAYVEIQLAASDYIEMFAWQNSGGNLNALGDAPNTFMSFRWLARTV